jgi:HEAT repeat protein
MRVVAAAMLFLLAAGCGGSPARDYSVAGCIKDLEDKDANIRYTAASVLGKYGPEAVSAVPALTKALGDADKNVRVGAAYALAEIGPLANSAVPALRKATKDRDQDVRDAAAYSLKHVEEKR